MRVVLSGVETNNKGAELMLYAILQQLEKIDPLAEVFIDRAMVPQGISYINTTLAIKFIPNLRISRISRKFHITGILNRLGLFFMSLNNCCVVKNVDFFIDGSGLFFADQREIGKPTIQYWKNMLRTYKKRGTKIVFLPQAFGPADKKETKEIIREISYYADLIYARELVSKKILDSLLGANEKIKKSTDFTSLVEGRINPNYLHLQGKVCLIPNFQMINMGIMTKEEYFDFLKDVIDICKNKGKDIYLLNHEGLKDELLCKEFEIKFGKSIEIVSRLNGLEVKGLISTAYLVISSRFHGVASTLNSCVPCLSTSWSHKYEELFKDYGQEMCVLDVFNRKSYVERIEYFLDETTNIRIRNQIAKKIPFIKTEVNQMWKQIWALKENL